MKLLFLTVELSICINSWLQICINFAENTHIFLIIVKKNRKSIILSNLEILMFKF